MLSDHGLSDANPVVAPGTTQMKVADGISALLLPEATKYRRGVG